MATEPLGPRLNVKSLTTRRCKELFRFTEKQLDKLCLCLRIPAEMKRSIGIPIRHDGMLFSGPWLKIVRHGTEYSCSTAKEKGQGKTHEGTRTEGRLCAVGGQRRGDRSLSLAFHLPSLAACALRLRMSDRVLTGRAGSTERNSRVADDSSSPGRNFPRLTLRQTCS